MTQNVDFSSFWSEIYYKTISELHSLSENCVIDEENTGTNNVKPFTFIEPDLGIYCIKNPDIFTCYKTLETIGDRINSILDFNQFLCKKADEFRTRITTDLLNLLTSICPNPLFKWPPTVYGSFENGLCCYESNINIHVEYYHSNVNELWRRIRHNISKRRRSKFSHERVEVDATGCELLLKMIHKETAIETVLSFTNEMRLYNAKLMQLYLNLNPNVKPLMLLLKHILELQNLLGEDKISTYQLFWLVVYYLQRKKLLPAVRDVRAIAGVPKYYVFNKWNCSVPHPESITFTSVNTVNESAASLFLGFVGFYKHFDFLRYVISPYFGYAVLLEDFDTWTISMNATGAEKLADVVEKMSFIKSVANYQDPTILDRNLFSSVPIKIINSFKHVCKYLYSYYHTSIFQENNFHITLPIVLPTHDPIDLIQYASIILNVENLPDLDRSIILAVRQLMENLLKFTLVKISKIERKTHNLVTVVYFDYGIDSENCDTVASSILNLIIQSVPGNMNFNPTRIGNNQFRIYIVCEIYTDKVVLLMEGIARLIEFFAELGPRLLQYIIRYTNRKETAI